MNVFYAMLEPQNTSLGFELWFFLLFIVGFTTYGLRLATGAPVVTLGTLLLTGGYLGNVAARALEIVAASTNVNVNMVIISCQATFVGMFVVMMIWFFFKLVLPPLLEKKAVVRDGQPKGVVGMNG